MLRHFYSSGMYVWGRSIHERVFVEATTDEWKSVDTNISERSTHIQQGSEYHCMRSNRRINCAQTFCNAMIMVASSYLTSPKFLWTSKNISTYIFTRYNNQLNNQTGLKISFQLYTSMTNRYGGALHIFCYFSKTLFIWCVRNVVDSLQASKEIPIATWLQYEYITFHDVRILPNP